MSYKFGPKTGFSNFNVGKCCVLHLGPNNLMANYMIYNPAMKVRERLENRAEERDLGVIIDDKLKFHNHVQHVVSHASFSLELLKQTINSRQASIFIKLCKTHQTPSRFRHVSCWSFLSTRCEAHQKCTETSNKMHMKSSINLI